ncbi:uncharacterized protein LOC124140524 [Haliotis rufescens]|uniref:uncharacterized protein LOC124140524 n=1 Tax=Haliotis rufescens TaxID=6454 RepID=UPI001EAFA0B6|nr:uncharacterized protein LOC124140524 [Haliotis rufescens]
MTSSSDANRSSVSDGTLDNLYKGMSCAYHKQSDASSDSHAETSDNANNEALNAVSGDYSNESSTIRRRRRRTDQIPDEVTVDEHQPLPSSNYQKDLSIDIMMNIQKQQDTLLKEIREIKDTQKEIQRDLVRLKGGSSHGDNSVTGLNYERRARYSIRPLSTICTQTFTEIQETPFSGSSSEETNEDVFNTKL